ncbi:hypothetical protein [Pseudonocardia alaniniphila]|uniref:Uncharacterized protein n=1 Tax=Pseudonocardia alaniniphila TaxID=75291 RepID=A0ABS9TIP5_9PSEU|nr:hypothetical protein [Pseudonocardia alaniniphila]MCH6168171.1 hypothetical protein [Pseudonocardia alaniniphila]
MRPWLEAAIATVVGEIRDGRDTAARELCEVLLATGRRPFRTLHRRPGSGGFRVIIGLGAAAGLFAAAGPEGLIKKTPLGRVPDVARIADERAHGGRGSALRSS